MDRLTKKIGNHVVFPEELLGVTLAPHNEYMYRLLTRLAAYEDTGLEPEEITKLAALAQNGQSAIDTNARLLKAQNEGRLIVLPSEYDPEIIAWMQDAWERFLKDAEAALGGDRNERL